MMQSSITAISVETDGEYIRIGKYTYHLEDINLAITWGVKLDMSSMDKSSDIYQKIIKNYKIYFNKISTKNRLALATDCDLFHENIIDTARKILQNYIKRQHHGFLVDQISEYGNMIGADAEIYNGEKTIYIKMISDEQIDKSSGKLYLIRVDMCEIQDIYEKWKKSNSTNMRIMGPESHPKFVAGIGKEIDEIIKNIKNTP